MGDHLFVPLCHSNGPQVVAVALYGPQPAVQRRSLPTRKHQTMKKHLQHPTYTAYYRDLQRELFVLDHGKEYGDNLFIETRTDSQVAERTTLAAIKAMVCDELMGADPVSRLQEAIKAMLKDPYSQEAQANGLKALQDTRDFGKEWR